jgi:hypothetical protein
VFSTTRKTTYIRKGEIVESVGEARERYAKAFAEFTSKRRFSFEEKQFDILDERTVLFAGLGVIESKQAEEPWRIAYTILWSLEPAGWKAIHMHISW